MIFLKNLVHYGRRSLIFACFLEMLGNYLEIIVTHAAPDWLTIFMDSYIIEAVWAFLSFKWRNLSLKGNWANGIPYLWRKNLS